MKKSKPMSGENQQERDPQTGKLKPLDVKADEIFQILCTMEPNTKLTELLGLLHDKEIKISYATLQKWSAKHQWIPRRNAAMRGVDPANTTSRLSALGVLATSANPETMDGLIAKWVHTVDKALDQVVIGTPDDLVTMMAGLDALIKVKTNFRGALIPPEPVVMQDEGKPAAVNENAPLIGEFASRVVKGGEVKGAS